MVQGYAHMARMWGSPLSAYAAEQTEVVVDVLVVGSRSYSHPWQLHRPSSEPQVPALGRR